MSTPSEVSAEDYRPCLARDETDGHACIVPEHDERTPHQCFCGLEWSKS